MGWWRRLRRTFSSRANRAVDDEMRFHIEERTDEYVRNGLPLEDARREAARRFGSRALTREHVRDATTVRWLDDLMRDLAYALRTLRRAPGFSAAALLTLALGVGLTTAVFSAVYGVLLRPLPYPGADRLVRVWEEHPGSNAITANRWLSNRTYHAWTGRAGTIDVLGGFAQFENIVRIDGDDERVPGGIVSPAVLSALGARPIVGRLFTPDEAEDGANRVAILAEALWRDRFGADPAIVGRTLAIGGLTHRVVGVVRADFSFPSRRVRYWTPYVIQRVSTDPELGNRTSALSAIARLAPEVTIAQLEAEGTAAARSVPVTMATIALFGKGGPPIVHARPWADDMTGEVRPVLVVVAAAVVCLLMIACANVANLLLSRGVARQRELAVRAAMGAGSGRLARQLFTESVALAVGGGLTGVVLAWTIVRLAPLAAPVPFPRLDDIQIDGSVLVFAVLATTATAVLCGLIPAVRGARFNLTESLRGGGDGAVAGGFRGSRARRIRDGLLVAESAFAIMLLVGAALLSRSFVRLLSVDTGYTVDHVLTARALMPADAAPERAGRFADTVLARVRAMPGVRSAGAGNMMPLSGSFAIASFRIPARSGDPLTVRALSYTVTPGYAEALGLRLRAGRLFDERDTTSSRRAVIVNDEFVRQYLANELSVGRQFVNLFRNDNGIVTEIVGVVGSVLKEGNDRRPQPEMYFPHGAAGGSRLRGGIDLVVRTSGEPGALASTLRQLLREADGAATIERVEPLADPLRASVAQPRFATAVLGSFAFVALALASIGLYGVLSYAVSQRRRELGVRAALGATRRRLIGHVLREGLTVTGIGAALGLAGAAALTRLMQSALFGVTPLDAVSFLSAPLVLVPVAAAACLVPALRAASVGPAEALRE